VATCRSRRDAHPTTSSCRRTTTTPSGSTPIRPSGRRTTGRRCGRP
jgi:hypothetical protein